MRVRTEPGRSEAPGGRAPVPRAVAPLPLLLARAGNRATARALQRSPGQTTIPPPRGFAVWAQHSGIEGSGNTCPDVGFARGEPGFPARQVGFDYTSLDDLIGSLRSRVQPGSVVRLTISCHGMQGVLRVEDQSEAHQLTADRLQAALNGDPTTATVAHGFNDQPYAADPAYFRRKIDQLREIAQFMAPAGRVLLFGCNAAAERQGSRLLRVLASPQLLGVPVIGFTRILRFAPVLSGGCTIPGAEPTNYQSPTGGPTTIDQQAEAAREGRTTTGRLAGENDPLTRIAVPGGEVTSRSDAAGDAVSGPLDDLPEAQGWGGAHATPARPPLESAAERRRAIELTGGFFGRPGHRHR